MSHVQHVPIEAMDPHRFESVIAPEQYEVLLGLIEHAASALRGRVIWNVNSTARGGGVVELLRPLLAYSRGGGVDARWAVISGGPEFFAITKRVHNQLHGAQGDGRGLSDADRSIYERTLHQDAAELVELVRPRDIVILHDPQTAGLVEAVRGTGAAVIWRCHVGLDRPNDVAREAWSFLRPFMQAADAYVFSRAAFAWEDLDQTKIAVIQPSIDVFSPKNADQSPEEARSILATAGLTAYRSTSPATFRRADGTPGRVDRRAEMLEEGPVTPSDRLLVQVSRWDRLKDPLGVLSAFVEHVADQVEAHLLLAGPSTESVADDPEGAEVFKTVRDAWHELPEKIRRRVHLAALPMDDIEENAAIVNALQHHADVVAQKSVAEGFGLTVAEAMWKRRPVVATRLGGIQDQIVDGESGVLISDPHDLAAFGSAVRSLLAEPERATRIGLAARERVRDRFLGPRHLSQYFEVFERLIELDRSA